MTEKEEIELEILKFCLHCKRTNMLATKNDLIDRFDHKFPIAHLLEVTDHILEMNYVDKMTKQDGRNSDFLGINSVGEYRIDRLTKNKKAIYWDHFRKKYWFWGVVAAFVLGVLSPIIVEWSRRKIWPESTQPSTKIVTTDSSAKK